MILCSPKGLGTRWLWNYSVQDLWLLAWHGEWMIEMALARMFNGRNELTFYWHNGRCLLLSSEATSEVTMAVTISNRRPIVYLAPIQTHQLPPPRHSHPSISFGWAERQKCPQSYPKHRTNAQQGVSHRGKCDETPMPAAPLRCAGKRAALPLLEFARITRPVGGCSALLCSKGRTPPPPSIPFRFLPIPLLSPPVSSRKRLETSDCAIAAVQRSPQTPGRPLFAPVMPLM